MKSLLQILIYRVDYITLNLNMQSGAGVPPTLIHYSLLLITSPKIDTKVNKNQGEALYVIRRKTECNHTVGVDVILSQKGM